MQSNHWKNPVFIVSTAIVVFLVLVGAIFPVAFGEVSGLLYRLSTKYFSWFYLFSVFAVLVFLVGLAISKFGGVRLGGESEKPDFPFFTWIGMLFSAGFGVGLVFWGVAEPMSHFFNSPFPGLEGQTIEAARIAMGYSFFHWGISQWAIYTMVGLAIGFLQFRRKEDGLISTALSTVVGNKKPVKAGIDSLAVIATIMGVATTLGLGVMQIAGGLNVVAGTGNSFWVQLCIIGLIFAAYMISSSTGVEKGIRILSNFNLFFALVFLLFVFFSGPTLFILETFTVAIGDYIVNFVSYSLRLQPYQGGTWVRDWTIFYWAWTIAWSPFVGAFIARVSRGRTIREFIAGVMFVPPFIACLWIAAFGGTALWHDLNLNAGIAEIVNEDVTLALFQLLEQLPFTFVLSVISLVLILTFLVTSADSAVYILASMTTGGSINPPLVTKFIWGILTSAIAGVLLYAGGLEALQTASLVSALPFTLVILILMVSLFKLIRKEPLPIRKRDIRQFERMEKELKKLKERKKAR